MKQIDEAIDALVMAAFTEGGCSEHRMSEARIQTELRKKELCTLLSTPQPCCRSHPHEEMTPMCELRTEIARLTNALARAEAQLAAAPQAVRAEVATGPCGQCKDTRQPCSCMIDTMLKERGLVAVDAAHYDKISARAKSAPAHPAEGVPAAKNGRQVLVDSGALQMVLNALERDALEGKQVRAAMRLELMQSIANLPQPAAQGVDVPPSEPMYYLQDARWSSMVGNCPSFWREGGNGYTTNLDEAGRFTHEEAMAQHRSRSTDLPWLCSEVDKLRRPTVDFQNMPRSWDARRAALAAQAKQGEQA